MCGRFPVWLVSRVTTRDVVEMRVSRTDGECRKLSRGVVECVSNSRPRLEVLDIFGPRAAVWPVRTVVVLLSVWPHNPSEPPYRLLRRLVAGVGIGCRF